MGTRAPNSSWTGSQFELKRKCVPYFSSVSELPTKSAIRMAARMLNTRKAKNFVRSSKNRSSHLADHCRGGGDFGAVALIDCIGLVMSAAELGAPVLITQSENAILIKVS